MSKQLKRRIPSLLLDGQHAAKSFCFSDWQYVGDPVQIARLFSQKEVDELIVIDPAVSRSGQSINLQLLKNIAQQFHGPITYGGGVCDAKTARQVIGLGFEKVAVNFATTATPEAMVDISSAVGEQAITLVFDLVIRDGVLMVFDHRSGKSVPITRDALLKEVNAAKAGEVILQFIDRDGTSTGLEQEITWDFASKANKQVVASCGSSDTCEVQAYLEDSAVSAVIASSLFTFFPQTNSVLINYV